MNSSLSGRTNISLGSGTLSEKVQNIGCKKQGAKTVSLLFKKKRGQAAFSGSQTDPCFQNKNRWRLTGQLKYIRAPSPEIVK